QSHLRDDEEIARPWLPRPGGSAASRILQIVLETLARSMNDGDETEHDRDQQRNREGEEQDIRAYANLADARQIAVIKPDDQPHAPRGEQSASDAARDGKQERFDKELARESAARRAQRPPQPHL